MKEILDLQREMMDRYKLDCLVTMAPENIGYVIGTAVPSQSNVRTRHVIDILTREDAPWVICVNIEEEFVKKNSWVDSDRVITYNEFLEDPIVVAANKLRELGMDGKRVGIEFGYLPSKDYLKLREVAPQIQFVDATTILEDMRKQKLQFELDIIEEFGRGAEKALLDGFRFSCEGMTEKELGAIITNGFNAAGGEKMSGLTVCSGPRSAMLNAPPTDRVLQKGDLIRVDLAGTKKGYFCDICRTAVVGEPSEEQANLYDLVKRSHDRILTQLKPGVDTHEIYSDFAEYFAAGGIDASCDFVAHGLGLSIHEEPYINRFAHNTLKENMAMCVEPIYVIPGVAAYHLENEVIITSTGCRVITAQESYEKMPTVKLK